MMNKLIRDPLLHFLLIGAGLFVVFEALNQDVPAGPGKKEVIVNRAALLNFVQFRNKAFQPELAAAYLNGLTEEQLQVLVDDFVREEVLYREAVDLGLEQNDYIIKRRLIQKLDFVTQGFAEATVDISEEEVRAYFAQSRDDYFVAPFVTFTHVFLDAERRGADDAQLAAAEMLDTLNTTGVPFAGATQYGDRFPYHVNYVERAPDFVASHFGPEMAGQVFDLPPDSTSWLGPYMSPYGSHLVMVSAKSEGHYPELSEIYNRVADDTRRVRLRELAEQAVSKVVDTYEVRIALDQEQPLGRAHAAE